MSNFYDPKVVLSFLQSSGGFFAILLAPREEHLFILPPLYSLAVVNCEEAESGQRRRSIEEWKKSSLLKNSIWALTLSQLQSENILPILSLGEFFAFTLGSVFNHETWLNSLLRSLAMYERTTTTLSLHVASTRFQHTNRVEQLLLLSPLLLLLSSSSSSTSSPSSSTCPLYTLLFSSSLFSFAYSRRPKRWTRVERKSSLSLFYFLSGFFIPFPPRRTRNFEPKVSPWMC